MNLVVTFLFLVSCAQGRRLADVMGRKRAVKPCKICGKLVATNHTSRHAGSHRLEESTSNVTSRASSLDRETVNDGEEVPQATSAQATASPPLEYVRATARSNSPPMEYVENAVLCMLRRVQDVNLPALSSYLAKHFPLIPPAWRAPIIVAAFTAVKKAAASYMDTVLRVDEIRTTGAELSLSRWAHGLSGIEPDYVPSRDSSVSSVNRDCFSPDTNLLLGRQVRVAVDSGYALAQAEAAFEGTSMLGEAVNTTSVNQVDQRVVSAQPAPIFGDSARLNDPAQGYVCFRNSSVSTLNPDCYSPTTNFLLDRQVPVGVDSGYALAQAEAAFEDTSVLGDAVTTSSTNQLVQLAVSSQLTLPTGLQSTEIDVRAQPTTSEGGLAEQSAATVSGGDRGSEDATELATEAIRYFSDLLHVDGMKPVLLDDMPQLLSPTVTPNEVAEKSTSDVEPGEISSSESPAAPRTADYPVQREVVGECSSDQEEEGAYLNGEVPCRRQREIEGRRLRDFAR